MKSLKVLVLLSGLILVGCHKGLLSISSDDLPPPLPQKPQGTAVMGFEEVNRLVFADTQDRNSCIGCHGEGISIRLVSYADYLANLDKVKLRVLEERNMPRPAGLSPSKLAIVRQWIEQGAPEFGSVPSEPDPMPTTTTTLPPVPPTTTTLPPVDPISTVVDFAEVESKVFSLSCAGCHGADGFIEPSLITYEDFKSNLDLVVSRVLVQKNMPRRGLPPEQLKIVQAWIDGGAVEKAERK